MFSDVSALNLEPALIVAQAGNWLPIWLTPVWLISVGLVLGAIVSLLIFGVLSILSFVPGLGTLANSPRRGVTASILVGAVFAALLCWQFVPGAGEYAQSLFAPLIVIGLILGFGVIYGMWHRTRSEWPQILSEGVVPYLLATVGIFALIGMSATYWVNGPMEFLDSISSVNLVGDGTVTLPVAVPGSPDVDADQAPFHQANLDYNLRNLSELTIESDRTVQFADAADPAGFSRSPIRINAGEKMVYRYEDRQTAPIPGNPERLHIQNRELDAANVVFTFKYLPPIPQVASAVGIAVCFVFAIAALVAFRQAAPRVWALALSTAKNEMAQPLYLLLLAIGLVGVLFFGIAPFNTMGDDIRMLKDSSATLIMVLGMLQAVWSAGTSVSDEIEGRTALTVLSKPVSRRSFILGKYAGIMLAVFVLFFITSAVLFIVLSYKPIYEARENGLGLPQWQTGFAEVMSMAPILGLYFMQTMAIAGVAVALATRLPLLANFITCFTIYVVGNLTSPLVASTRDNNELVGFVGKLIAVVVPNLNVFNVQSAVDSGNPIPLIYLAGAFNYLGCFVIAVWMLAMLLFEDRDLA